MHDQPLVPSYSSPTQYGILLYSMVTMDGSYEYGNLLMWVINYG